MNHLHSTPRVLLADDHALVRSGLHALLDQVVDVEVVGEVGNGRDAIDAVGELKPDIVIMDIAMPEMNGLEALARIKSLHPNVRVIVLSMYENPEHVRRALAGGADGYVVKAAAQEELELAVRAAWRGDSYLSPAVTRGALDPQVTGAASLDALTPRQREIMQLVVEGNSTKGIARKLDLSTKTVEAHRSQVMTRLGIRNVPDLVRYAIGAGVISAD